jgi:hypothetical protein
MARSMAVVSKLKQMFQTGSGTSLKQAFKSQQEAALATWRRAAARHLDGESIDIGELVEVGPQIGIPGPAVASTFSKDVETLREAREHEEYVAKMHAAALQADADAVGMADEVIRLNQALADAIRRRDAPQYVWSGHAFAGAPLHQLRINNPRLWDDGRRIDEHRFEDALSLPVQPLEGTAPADPYGDEAGFIVDGKDD